MRYRSSHIIFCLLFSLIASDSSVFAEGIRVLGPNGEVQQILNDDGAQSPAVEPSRSASPARYFGPTSNSQTLWSIASQVRPDNSVTVQQTLLAIFQLNPQAFEDQNIHQLVPGSRLRIPSLNQISALSTQQAIAVMAADKARLTGQFPTNLAQADRGAVAAPESNGNDGAEKPATQESAEVSTATQAPTDTASPAPEAAPSQTDTTSPAKPAVNLASLEANNAKPVPVLEMARTDATQPAALSNEQSQELQSLTEKNHQLRVMLANVQHELAALQGDVNDKARIEQEVQRILSEQQEQQLETQRLTPTTFDQFASNPWLVAAAAFIPGALLSTLLLLILSRRKAEPEQAAEETQPEAEAPPAAEQEEQDELLLMPDEETDISEESLEENPEASEFDDLSDGINFNLDDEEEFSDLDDELANIEASSNGIGVNGDEAALGLKDMERALDEAGDELMLEEESSDASLALDDDDFDLTDLDGDEQSLELSQDDLDDLLSSASEETNEMDAVEQALDGNMASDDDIDQLLSQFDVNNKDSSPDPFALDDDDENHQSLDELEALAGLSDTDEDEALAAELAESSDLLDDVLSDELSNELSEGDSESALSGEETATSDDNQDDALDELEALAGLSDTDDTDEDEALAAELAESSDLLDDVLSDELSNALSEDDNESALSGEETATSDDNQDDALDELEALAGLSDIDDSDEDEALAAELAESSDLLDDVLGDELSNALSEGDSESALSGEETATSDDNQDDALDELEALAGLSDIDDTDEDEALATELAESSDLLDDVLEEGDHRDSPETLDELLDEALASEPGSNETARDPLSELEDSEFDDLELDGLDLSDQNFGDQALDNKALDGEDREDLAADNTDIDNLDLDNLDLDSLDIDNTDLDSSDANSLNLDDLEFDNQDLDNQDLENKALEADELSDSSEAPNAQTSDEFEADDLDDESLMSTLLDEQDVSEPSQQAEASAEQEAFDEQAIESLLDDPSEDLAAAPQADEQSEQESETAQTQPDPAKPFNRNEFIDDLQQIAPQKDPLLDDEFSLSDEQLDDTLTPSSEGVEPSRSDLKTGLQDKGAEGSEATKNDLPENEFGKPSDEDWQFDDVDLDSLLSAEAPEAIDDEELNAIDDVLDEPINEQDTLLDGEGGEAPLEKSEASIDEADQANSDRRDDTQNAEQQAPLNEQQTQVEEPTQPVGFADDDVLSDDDLFSAEDDFDSLDASDDQAIPDDDAGETPVGFGDDDVLSDDALFSAIEDEDLDVDASETKSKAATSVDSEEQDALFEMFENNHAYTSKEVEQFDEKAMANLLSDEANPADFDLNTLDDGGSSAGMDFDAMLEMGEDWSGFNREESELPLDEDEQEIWADSEALKQPEIQAEDWHKQDSVSSQPKQKFMTIDELMAQVEAEESGETPSVDDELQLNVGLSEFPDVIGDLDDEDVDINAEAAGKLDLAKIYIEMNDDQGAKKLLEEAIVDGNDGIRREAKSLIDYLNDRSYE